MTNLLLVEDDTAISGPLMRALAREGYNVELAELGRDALTAMERGIDMAILDLGLPDMDGLDVARQARSRGWDFPILILTARTEEVDMVVGLDAGADDYVTKPFRLAELMARMRALLRRQAARQGCIGIGQGGGSLGLALYRSQWQAEAHSGNAFGAAALAGGENAHRGIGAALQIGTAGLAQGQRLSPAGERRCLGRRGVVAAATGGEKRGNAKTK